jgi:hypothetical protein
MEQCTTGRWYPLTKERTSIQNRNQFSPKSMEESISAWSMEENASRAGVCSISTHVKTRFLEREAQSCHKGGGEKSERSGSLTELKSDNVGREPRSIPQSKTRNTVMQ